MTINTQALEDFVS
jgi:ribonuclease HI